MGPQEARNPCREAGLVVLSRPGSFSSALLAMQKVVGSNPISRLAGPAVSDTAVLPAGQRLPARRLGIAADCPVVGETSILVAVSSQDVCAEVLERAHMP